MCCEQQACVCVSVFLSAALGGTIRIVWVRPGPTRLAVLSGTLNLPDSDWQYCRQTDGTFGVQKTMASK